MIPEGIREKDLCQEWDELHLLMRRLGVAGAGRASFYLYNTSSEVRTFLQGTQNA
ncbi:MAG TPA: hypothetical protein VGQ08_14020 [Nitrospiraceae bacterium]|jgi:selenocysteine lyase/cysteine desulfurase|nr:hypothetical protein [Nitrospiraceae bacterium]